MPLVQYKIPNILLKYYISSFTTITVTSEKFKSGNTAPSPAQKKNILLIILTSNFNSVDLHFFKINLNFKYCNTIRFWKYIVIKLSLL